MGTAQIPISVQLSRLFFHRLQQLSGSGDDANDSFTYDRMTLPWFYYPAPRLESLYFLDFFIFVGDGFMDSIRF